MRKDGEIESASGEILMFRFISMAMRKEAARESRLRHRQRISQLDGRGRSILKRV